MNQAVKKWVDETAALTKPDRVVWCDGSEEENARLIDEMVEKKVLHPLNEERYPNCYLHRSDPNDVARTEHLTFICTATQGRRRPDQQLDGPARGEARSSARCSTAR